MKNNRIKSYIFELLNYAEICLNGNNPWDLKVHNQEFYEYIMHHGSLGLGMSYMEGWWDCERLDQFFEKLIKARIPDRIQNNKINFLKFLMLKMINFQSKRKSLDVARVHYDLGNELFESMLDVRMNYTCGYWRFANNLNDAQQDKLELTCKKLAIKPNMRILDIGCGFGAFAKYAAENYDANIVGITISKEQVRYAQNLCAGLQVEIRLQDYRDLNEKFDRIVSLGMFEHVGYKNYTSYMKIVHDCLEDDGLFLLHTIGSNVSGTSGDEWLTKYIFPNGMLPSIAQIGKASENLFIMEDWHNFGADYDKTLMAWYNNFTKSWHQLKNKYTDNFYRMWCYYLLSCAGIFRSRHAQLWQIVFSKHGIYGGYQVPPLYF